MEIWGKCVRIRTVGAWPPPGHCLSVFEVVPRRILDASYLEKSGAKVAVMCEWFEPWRRPGTPFWIFDRREILGGKYSWRICFKRVWPSIYLMADFHGQPSHPSVTFAERTSRVAEKKRWWRVWKTRARLHGTAWDCTTSYSSRMSWRHDPWPSTFYTTSLWRHSYSTLCDRQWLFPLA